MEVYDPKTGKIINVFYEADWDVMGRLHEIERNGCMEELKEFVGKLSLNDWMYLTGQIPKNVRLGRLSGLRQEYKKENRKIFQIPVAYEDACELVRLTEFLKEREYAGNTEGSGPKVLVIDHQKKRYFRTNVTGMACWCSGRRYPIGVNQIIGNYDRIVIDDDVVFYDELTKTRLEERRKTDGSSV